MLAAKGRNFVIQELLLGRGADVNWADQAGMTALHYESAHGDSEAVKLLLAFGADPNPVDVVSDSLSFGVEDLVITFTFIVYVLIERCFLQPLN